MQFMTLKDLLGQVVGSLQDHQAEIASADPEHAQKMLNRFEEAYQAAPSDPNADLGAAMGQLSSMIGGQSGFTAKAYSEAFGEGAQMFQGQKNNFSLNDLAPLVGMLANGFARNDTRGANAAGPLGAIAPLLQLLGGGGNLSNIIGALMGGGQNNAGMGNAGLGGGLGGLLGQLATGAIGNALGSAMGGNQQNQNSGLGGLLGGLLGQQLGQQRQAPGGLGGLLGSLMGGAQQVPQQNNSNDILSQLIGAVTQGKQMVNAQGQPDAGAISTSAVLQGLLRGFLK